MLCALRANIDSSLVTEPVGQRSRSGANPSDIACARQGRCNAAMSTKSREVISEVGLRAPKSARRVPASAPGRLFARPTAPRPKSGQFAWKAMAALRSRYRRSVGVTAATAGSRSDAIGCKTVASIPLDCVRRPKDTAIWKLEASLKCRSCRKGRYAPLVHMIRLTEERQHSWCNGAIGCSVRRQLSKHIGYWPISEVEARVTEVRSRAYSGLNLLRRSSSRFDP
jgi:hypothetical protein